MDTLTAYLLEYGYWGMFVASFLAGTVIPFASEAVLVALIRMGLDPVLATLSATAGNTVGSMTCYWIGHLGNRQWIEKYLRVKEESMQRAYRFLQGRGAWMGFFSFLPILGTPITIALGLMRSNVWITTIAIAVGALVRYVASILVTDGLHAFILKIWN